MDLCTKETIIGYCPYIMDWSMIHNHKSHTIVWSHSITSTFNVALCCLFPAIGLTGDFVRIGHSLIVVQLACSNCSFICLRSNFGTCESCEKSHYSSQGVWLVAMALWSCRFVVLCPCPLCIVSVSVCVLAQCQLSTRFTQWSTKVNVPSPQCAMTTCKIVVDFVVVVVFVWTFQARRRTRVRDWK